MRSADDITDPVNIVALARGLGQAVGISDALQVEPEGFLPSGAGGVDTVLDEGVPVGLRDRDKGLAG